LVAFCSFGVLDEEVPIGNGPLGIFEVMIVLVFLFSIFIAQVPFSNDP
jgi:hypothetical protein